MCMYDTPQEAGRGHQKLLLSILVSENFFFIIFLKLVYVDYRWCQNGWIDSHTFTFFTGEFKVDHNVECSLQLQFEGFLLCDWSYAQ